MMMPLPSGAEWRRVHMDLPEGGTEQAPNGQEQENDPCGFTV